MPKILNHNVSSEISVESCYMTYVVLKPSTSYIVNSVVGCVVNAIFAILGTFLNSLVIWVFWKTPKLRHRVCYFMIMILSSMDLCVSVIVHPLHLVNSIAEITETSNCYYKMFYQTSAILFSGTSTMIFFLMNIERYLSIVFPFFHRVHVTKKRCLILSCAMLFICIPTAVAPIFKLKIQIFVTILAVTVCLGTLVIYISIYYVARRQNRVRKTVGSLAEQGISVTVDQEQEQSKLQKQKNILSENKMSLFRDLLLAKTYLFVVFCNFFFQLPNAIVLSIWRETLTTIDGVVQVKVWTVSLVAMTSTLNCLIFFWSNKILRIEGLKIVRKFFN